MKDQGTKEKFVELRAKGLSFDRIAAELKVSKQTLINWTRELENEIHNLKRIELEALQEQYSMLKAQRITFFGEKLKAIREELDKRDLSELPTMVLFDMFLKCYRQFESVDTVFCGTKELMATDMTIPDHWQG